MPQAPQSSAPGHYAAPHLRKATGHFLLGRAGTAVCGLLTGILLARWMDMADYGAYALFTGLALLTSLVSSLGLGEVAHRFLPELAVRNAGQGLGRAMLLLLGLRLAALALFAGLLYLGAPWLASFFDVGAARNFQLACGMFVTFTLFLFCCLLLETVLRQALVKWLMLGTSTAKLLALGVIYAWTGAVGLPALLWVDIAVYSLAALPALVAVTRYALGSPAAPPVGPEPPADATPLMRRVLPYAGYSYLLLLVTLQDGAVNKLVAGAVLPVAALALFGFAQNMVDILQRHLPNILLLNIVRPAIMAHWSSRKDHTSLALRVNLFFKLNLLLLLPVLAWLVVSGRPLADFLSKGRYTEAGTLLFGLGCLQALQCHNRRYELILQALERTRLLFLGNLWVVASVPLAVLLAHLLGIWGIVLASGLGLLARDIFLHRALLRLGAPPGLDLTGWGKLLLAALLPALLMGWLLPPEQGLLWVLVSGAACTVGFAGLALVLRPLSPEELQTVRGFFKR